jgi:hypothetical protein
MSCKTYKNEIWVIPAIHGLHYTNPNYTFEHLYEKIDSIQPDLIGIEIRNEDLYRDTLYLMRNYPYEMRSLIGRYDSNQVIGIDWLGKDLKGKPIPEDYWQQQSTIKKLENDLDHDSTMQSKLVSCDSLILSKVEFAEKASLEEMMSGHYDSLNVEFYSKLFALFEGTPYIELKDYYQQRDVEISKRIFKVIRKNSKKKLVFVVGADHRAYTLEYLKSKKINAN